MDILTLYYCFYFECVGPGQEQHNLPELRVRRVSGHPWAEGEPPTVQACSPLPGLLHSPMCSWLHRRLLLTALSVHCPPPPAWHSKLFSSSPHSSSSQSCPDSGQVLLRNPLLGAHSMWTPYLFSSWGPAQTPHPILDAPVLESSTGPIFPLGL